MEPSAAVLLIAFILAADDSYPDPIAGLSFFGVAALLIALLKVFRDEVREHRRDRERWNVERDEIMEAYRAELDAAEARQARIIESIRADYEQQVVYLRRRIQDCEEAFGSLPGRRWYDTPQGPVSVVGQESVPGEVETIGGEGEGVGT